MATARDLIKGMKRAPAKPLPKIKKGPNFDEQAKKLAERATARRKVALPAPAPKAGRTVGDVISGLKRAAPARPTPKAPAPEGFTDKIDQFAKKLKPKKGVAGEVIEKLRRKSMD